MSKSIDDWTESFEYVEFSTKEDARKCVDLIRKSIDANNKQWMERVEKAFKSKYQGAGEVFFPYESLGNCTKKEEADYIEQEWQELKNLITTHAKENV